MTKTHSSLDLFPQELTVARGGSRTAATSKMEHFVIIVNGFGGSSNFRTKSSRNTSNFRSFSLWIRIIILKLHAITKRLEICIDINIEVSIFFLQMAYELLSQSEKLNKRGVPKKSERVGEFFEIKISGEGRLLGTQ